MREKTNNRVPFRVIDLSVATEKSKLDRTNSVNCYLKDIRKYVDLDAEEEAYLCRRARLGDMQAREKVIGAHQRFVYAVAKRVCHGCDIMDLVSEGNIALMDVLDNRYDTESGNRLLSYAVHYIHRRMIDYLNNNHTVNNLSDSRIGSKVFKIKNEFLSDNYREPTNEEIADILKERFDIDIKDPSVLNNSSCVSVNKKASYDSETELVDLNVFNDRTCSRNHYEEQIEHEETRRYTNNLSECLNQNERTVINKIFGLNGETESTPEQIADELGVCRERVRQIKQRALEKMLKYGEQITKEKRADKRPSH